MKAATVTRKEPHSTDSSSSSFSCRTILFNCHCHSFDEVESQLIKATRCTLSQARNLSWKIHNTGSAVVYTGHRERCEAVAMVLAEIGLIVKVSD